MNLRYPHLQLIDWPFRIVPDKWSCSFIADRNILADEVKTLLRNLSHQPISTMHLMWAWFGAGKTHTLHHIQYLCENEYRNVIPAYVEFPRSVKGFLEIYKSFISNIDMDFVDEAYVNVFGSKDNEKLQKELKHDYPDLANALKLHFTGDEQQQDLTVRWLKAECREIRTLKTVGIFRPILTSEEAIKVITWLVRLMNGANPSLTYQSKRILWMLDEYQRIEGLRKPIIDEINGCMHSIFNRCPNALSIIISFSGYPEEKRLPPWLSPEIKDRLDKKPLLLPPLSKEEAVVFVKEVLKHFRNPSTDIPNEYFPFTYESADAMIKTITDKAKTDKRHDEPKPRTIMHIFHTVLQEAEPLIARGEMKIINPEFAGGVLRGISFLEED